MTFLKDDQERARQEMDCYEYCLQRVLSNLQQQEFAKAAAYLENASRSLRALEKMKIAKQTFDHSWFEIKQIEGQQAVDRAVAELRARI